MEYPLILIQQYARGEISRAEFIHQYSKLQGFDGQVKGVSTGNVLYLSYRGTRAVYTRNKIQWADHDTIKTADTIKEFKIKVDTKKSKIKNLFDRALEFAAAANEAELNRDYYERERNRSEHALMLEAIKRIARH